MAKESSGKNKAYLNSPYQNMEGSYDLAVQMLSSDDLYDRIEGTGLLIWGSNWKAPISGVINVPRQTLLYWQNHPAAVGRALDADRIAEIDGKLLALVIKAELEFAEYANRLSQAHREARHTLDAFIKRRKS